jgi:hypothetical protein
LGTIVWVSNPVTQRLTVFSEDASVSKKNLSFFSPGRAFLSVSRQESALTVNKKNEPAGSLFIEYKSFMKAIYL